MTFLAWRNSTGAISHRQRPLSRNAPQISVPWVPSRVPSTFGQPSFEVAVSLESRVGNKVGFALAFVRPESSAVSK